MRQGAIAILVLPILVVCCGDQRSASPGPPAGLRPISIRVDGPTEVAPGAEVRFIALQMWSDGSTRDVTSSARWESSNPAVLTVSGGLAKALAPGEVRLAAHVDQLPVNPKGVRVVPTIPEWQGRYTLTIGGGACSESLPLAPELRRRRYVAEINQGGLRLWVTVPKVGGFDGMITNPEVRFTIYRARGLSRRIQKASILGTLPLTGAPRFPFFTARKAAYSGTEPEFVEVVNGNRLVISGQAVTTMSSAGFAGTLNGSLSLYEPERPWVLGVCSSPYHEFTLVRE
jgi:hypothetical protein